MPEDELEVVGIDSFSGKNFVVYFSDNTFISVTASKLAECFPDRLSVADTIEAPYTEEETDTE